MLAEVLVTRYRNRPKLFPYTARADFRVRDARRGLTDGQAPFSCLAFRFRDRTIRLRARQSCSTFPPERWRGLRVQEAVVALGAALLPRPLQARRGLVGT